MRAHASCRSLVWMPSRLIARSIAVSESVATCARQASYRLVFSRGSFETQPYLVPQAAAAAVNHDTNLADAVDAHLVRRPGVEDLVHHLGAGALARLHCTVSHASAGCAPESPRSDCLRQAFPSAAARASWLAETPARTNKACVSMLTASFETRADDIDTAPFGCRRSACARTPRSALCLQPKRSPRGATCARQHAWRVSGTNHGSSLRTRCAPVHAHLQRSLQRGRRRRDDALRAHTDGDVVEEGLSELLLDLHTCALTCQPPHTRRPCRHTQHLSDVALHQVRAQQAHAAVDVKAHTACRCVRQPACSTVLPSVQLGTRLATR